jgi:hypothetical protein
MIYAKEMLSLSDRTLHLRQTRQGRDQFKLNISSQILKNMAFPDLKKQARFFSLPNLM